jgi:hypothetical protein
MSRNGLKPTSQRFDCEICGDSAGRCRSNGELILCMSHPNGDAADDRWFFHGPSQGMDPGLWGVYTPRRYDSPRKRDWRETYLDDIQSDMAAAALRTAVQTPRLTTPQLKPNFTETPTASIPQRHDAYSQLFNSWELHPRHRAALSTRYGFTVNDANAHLLGSISVGPGAAFLHRGTFPGCTGTGVLRFNQPGIALSITDEQQRILGVELRLDDPGNSGRYRWLSRPEHSELGIPEYDGENPLGIYASVRGGQIYGSCTGNDLIGISEGRGMKPRICASRWGFPVIGGGGHAAATGAPIQLNRYLLLNPEATVLLLVDAGGLCNPRVVQHLLLTTRFCRQRGHQVLIPWWGQDAKNTDPDPDETPSAAGDFFGDDARYITWSDGRNVPLWSPEALGLEG